MGWFTDSLRALELLPEKRAGSGVESRAFTSSAAIPSNLDGYGESVTGFLPERAALQHLAVYSCVRLLADSIASLPVDVYRKQGDVRVPLPSPLVIADPDGESTGFEYLHMVVTSLALRGNSYELITSRDERTEWPTSRVALHPDDVLVDRSRDTGSVQYKVRAGSSWEVVPNADLLHVRRFRLAGSPVGLSPIEQARQGIGLGLAAERYGARWFHDSANPSSVLETEANLPRDESLAVMESWIATHGGRRHPAVLSGGLKYRPIMIMPNESQFLETREFQRGEIAMLFGVPPHMIGDTQKSTSWGSGIEQQSIGFVKFTLMPWLRCIEDAYSRYLLPRGQYMRFNVSALLRGDTTSRFNAYTQARTASWLSVNEIRALEDLPPVPDGDTYIQPLNMAPLGSDPLAAKATADTGGPDDEED